MFSLSRALAAQVTMSEVNLNTVVSTSTTVTEIQEESKMMRNLLSQSDKLLDKYGRRQNTDTVLIILALVFFYGCCFYVIWKRLYW